MLCARDSPGGSTKPSLARLALLMANSHYQSTSSTTTTTTTSARNRRYQSVPAVQEHLYASLASWQADTPQNLPFAPSLHQLPGALGPRPLPANHLYYSPGPTDYVNHLPLQSPWTDHDGRSAWSSPLYGDAGVDSTVPHPNAASHLGHPENIYRPTGHSQALPLPLPQDYSAASAAPPYAPGAPRAASVAHLLNYPSQTIRWSAGPTSDVPPVPQDGRVLSHTSAALSSGVVAPSIGNLSSSPWTLIDGAVSSSTTPLFERTPAREPEWTLVEDPSQNAAQPHPQTQQLVQFPSASLSQQPQQPPVGWASRQDQGSTASARQKLPRISASFTERAQKMKISKRHAKFNEEQKAKTAYMRKIKQCIRCKFYRTGCDPGTPCQRCTRVHDSARSFLEPCSRDHLDDASLVRHCNGRLNQSKAFFLNYSWKEGDSINAMDIVWNLPGFGPMPMCDPIKILFREYSPKDIPPNLNPPDLDPTAQYWQNTAGQVNRVLQPPYAVYDTTTLKTNVEIYFLRNQIAIEQWILHRVKDDELALMTYREALRKRDAGSSLLQTAMQLQCLSIVSQGYGSVWSSNIPGIKEYDYRQLGRSGYEAYDRPGPDRPLPAAIAHQMDVAILEYLQKLEKQCAKELMKKVFQPKLKPWYELFLTFFVLLWNLEYIHNGAESYIMSKSGTALENQVSYVVRSQIAEWEHAAPTILQHWRCVLRGFVPFKLARENPMELREKGMLNQAEFDYVMRVADMLEHRGPERFSGPSSRHAPLRNSIASKWIPQLFKDSNG
ncbi:uncharacterized protein BDR25DRAFT_93493 [Lindgomyces ingoldianus]|uniref:Uncharacterized protein n=1 Tax=Lindgomyces ingoldianus TaxID=673940 RepID=A0ACB6QD20_9PLEO|nr:uncharacterized protein BDR25DRAFT_93493 [Lindgomyces ingoldianus]KAF2464863.1 hypothetical protein BDR25DRAFT_93493 [Lindgomyces ingoldianus]